MTIRGCFSAVILTVLFIVAGACASHSVRNEAARGAMRGLYIPNRLVNRPDYLRVLVERGRKCGINMLVMDAHPFMVHAYRVDPAMIALCKAEGMYLAARVVCFQDGLRSLPVPDETLRRIMAIIESAASAGFDEVQLDYIRFADGPPYYPLAVKYGFIDEVLMKAREITDKKRVLLSADLFGRVVFNRDDIIGQKLENVARRVAVIYPMLYPSHFTGDKERLAKPGETMREGTEKGIERLKGTGVALHPYIQAFPYNIQWARIPLSEYVKCQIEAVESTSARGWVAWNPKGEYEAVFAALAKRTD